MEAVRLVRMSGSHSDVLGLQRTLESAPRYALAITGRPPAADGATTLLREVPPGKSQEDKFVFGVYVGDHLVGCADVLRGYPQPGTAFIGLLLVGEEWQGRGFGLRACREMESLIAGWACDRARLAVVRANASALGFWRRAGFTETGECVDYSCGTVRSELVLMEKTLEGEAQ